MCRLLGCSSLQPLERKNTITVSLTVSFLQGISWQSPDPGCTVGSSDLTACGGLHDLQLLPLRPDGRSAIHHPFAQFLAGGETKGKGQYLALVFQGLALGCKRKISQRPVFVFFVILFSGSWKIKVGSRLILCSSRSTAAKPRTCSCDASDDLMSTRCVRPSTGQIQADPINQLSSGWGLQQWGPVIKFSWLRLGEFPCCACVSFWLCPCFVEGTWANSFEAGPSFVGSTYRFPLNVHRLHFATKESVAQHSCQVLFFIRVAKSKRFHPGRQCLKRAILRGVDRKVVMGYQGQPLKNAIFSIWSKLPMVVWGPHGILSTPQTNEGSRPISPESNRQSLRRTSTRSWLARSRREIRRLTYPPPKCDTANIWVPILF